MTCSKQWLTFQRTQVSSKSPTGAALKYIAKYWDGLNLFLTDGRIEIDNNTVERAIRPIALQRKNALFAGHDAGAQNWAMLASILETCKLNQIEPHSHLTGILTAIANGHKQKDIDELLPWNFRKYKQRLRSTAVLFEVLKYDVFCDGTIRRRKEPTSPKVTFPIAFPGKRTFLSYFERRTPIHFAHKIADRQFRWYRNKHMHMITREYTFDDFNTVFCSDLTANISNTDAQLTMQNLKPVFPQAHDVIAMIINAILAA